MRNALIIFLSVASFAALAGVQPAAADCRSDNIACNKMTNGSPSCGTQYLTCVRNSKPVHSAGGAGLPKNVQDRKNTHQN